MGNLPTSNFVLPNEQTAPDIFIACNNLYQTLHLTFSLYLCSLSWADSYCGRHPAGPDLASFAYQGTCPSIRGARFCLPITTSLCWYRPKVPLPATHGNPGQAFSLLKNCGGTRTIFFPSLKKRRFLQIEKQITICCKLTGFSICLCWQGPCQPVCKAISQKIFCPSPLIPPPPSFLLTLLTWEMGWRW